jgi:uncharacterized protein with ParB-like and HNH nuclease domain
MTILLEQLNKKRNEIKTDHYSMSVGEIINLYKEKDIILDPAFQRLFRWSDETKSKFIESVLLGIPIPEIFVAQQKNGKWSIVDGLQRVSTMLQLVESLPNKPPLTMTTTKYLPALNGLKWVDLEDDVQRIFKKSVYRQYKVWCSRAC